MISDVLQVQESGAVLTLRMNRPEKRNALNDELVRARDLKKRNTISDEEFDRRQSELDDLQAQLRGQQANLEQARIEAFEGGGFATIVSRVAGLSVMRTVMASTSILSQVTLGNSLAISAAISSQRTMPCRCALDLVTTVNFFRGRDWASRKAKRMIRCTPARV